LQHTNATYSEEELSCRVSILVFLDSLATNLFLERKALPKELCFCFAKSTSIFISGEGIGNPNLFFWIKPFSKRFDVSILVFVDSLATRGFKGAARL